MANQNGLKALITLFIFVSVWLFSFIAHLVSAAFTAKLILSGLDRPFEMILYNFIGYYVLGALLSLLTFYFISIFQTKYLTRPLQATCITAVCVQLIGALGYIGLWNDANYSQFMVLITTHYNSLIALSLVQGLLFFNWWANGYTGHIDKFRIFRRDYYNNRVLTPEPIKID
jgi:NhaP-type Na+/H+ or K+/H+ antiporter